MSGGPRQAERDKRWADEFNKEVIQRKKRTEPAFVHEKIKEIKEISGKEISADAVRKAIKRGRTEKTN